MEIFLPYIIPALIRVFGSLVILRWPFWGYLFALFLDAIDREVAVFLGNTMLADFQFNWAWYQVGDKILDMYMLTLAVFMSRLWPEGLARKTGYALYIYRLLGVVLFTFIQARWILFFFPNIFEFYYIFCAFMKRYWPDFRMAAKSRLAGILALLFVAKVGQEYVVHIAEIPTWPLLRDIVLNFLRKGG